MSLLPLGILASSAAANYEFLALGVVNSLSAYIEFGSIPQGYKHLQIRYVARSVNTAGNTGTLYLDVNGGQGGSGGTARWHYLAGNGGSVTSIGGAIATIAGYTANGGAGNNIFSSGIIDIPDYSLTGKSKTFSYISGCAPYGVAIGSGLWTTTSPVTSISLFNAGWDTATRFALYGIKE